MKSARLAMESAYVKELVTRVNLAIERHRPHLLGLINEMEKFFLENKEEINAYPLQFKPLKKIYHRAIKKFSNDLEETSGLIICNLEEVTAMNPDKNKLPESHQACSSFTDNLALKVADDLLFLGKTLDQRTLAWERWVAIMCRLFNRRDYQTVSAILSAFDFASIGRLNATREGLTEKAQEIKAAIENLVSKQALLIANRSKPIIPRFVYYTGHFTKLMDRLQGLNMQGNEAGSLEEKEKISFQTREINKQLQRYVDEFSTIQAVLNEEWKKKSINIYFYMKMTENVINYKEKEAFLYSASLQHEPRGKKIKASTVLKEFPQFSLNRNKKVFINKRCQLFLEMDRLVKSIENHNTEIKEVLRELEEYSKSKKENAAKYLRVEAIRVKLRNLEYYVSNSVGRGSIPDISHYLHYVERELSQPNNSRHTHFDYLKKQINISTSLAEKLKLLKSHLEKAENLEAKRIILLKKIDYLGDKKQNRISCSSAIIMEKEQIRFERLSKKIHTITENIEQPAVGGFTTALLLEQLNQNKLAVTDNYDSIVTQEVEPIKSNELGQKMLAERERVIFKDIKSIISFFEIKKEKKQIILIEEEKIKIKDVHELRV